MKRTILNVPEGIRYLSDWKNFKDILPNGKIILNKSLPDCGASSWFLSNNDDVILASPRLSMLKCKSTDKNLQDIYWFKADSNYIDLKSYIQYQKTLGKPIKIIVTYDSLHLILNAVNLNNTTVVIDEMQCLISDAAFKGDTILDIVNVLNNIPNIVFLSATIYEDYYLDNLDIFKDADYIKLVWSNSVTRPIQTQLMKITSIRAQIKEIVERYRRDGYFERKMINGQPIYAKEAVFYLNSISDIVKSLKAVSLTKKDVNIICSTLGVNKLKKLGFNRGDPPERGALHKPFTFVTKASFEGADFYSECAYTYIFCDPSIDCLALDLYIDVPQIMGRQRLEINPFKYDATIFYKTSINFYSEKEFLEYVSNKEKSTRETIDMFNSFSDSPSYQNNLARLTEVAHKASGFSENYLTVATDKNGNKTLHENFMVKVAEARAWQIQSQQYSSEIRMLTTLYSSGISCHMARVITPNSIITNFTNEFFKDNNFERKMKFYCDFRDSSPDYSEMLEATTSIPIEFHQYYRLLGSQLIRAKSYKEASLKKELGFIQNHENIKNIVNSLFIVGNTYTLKEIKKSLQSIYDNLGVSRVAKAADLVDFFNTKLTTVIDPQTKKTANAYKILPK